MRKILLGLVVVITLFVIGFTSAVALTSEELQNQINDLTAKLTDTRNRATSLASQIAYMDSQIKLTTLRITETKNKIVELGKEIDDLKLKIGDLELSLTKVSEVLIDRIVATYKTNDVTPFTLLLSSDGFPDLLSRAKYLRLVQTHDKKLMFAIQATKTDFEEQKTLLEDKKKELDALNKKLEVQMVALDQQKKDKEVLLTMTRNDERRYQQLREQALKELAQIQQAAAFLKAGGTPIKVKKGDVIGTQGSTGYSTGDHLHFGIYNYGSIESMPGSWYYGSYVDPSSVLASKSVSWDEGCGNDGQKNVGSGSWDWPLRGDFRVTQGFGNTCYSKSFYNGNPHPAFDLAGPSGSGVYAVEEGNAYTCRNCLGDGGNGVFIFHPNGKMTLYWHLR